MDYKCFKLGLVSLLMTTLISCSFQTDLIEDASDNLDIVPKTCVMLLNASKPGFDVNTRGDEGWENGDKIYLLFYDGNEQSRGYAVYNDGIWIVSYYGSLSAGGTNNCKAVYFDSPEFESGTIVTLSANTGIYEATEGTYIYNDGTLTVTAVLSPKTARIRFEGEEGESVKVLGVSHYSSYDCTTGNFGTSTVPVDMTVTDCYTPYFYGYFQEDEPRLSILTNDFGFTKILAKSIFQAGQSGYMTIPTVESHVGWENIVTFKVNGIEFNMISVEWEGGNFLMAETETTNALYNAVMDESNSPDNVPYMSAYYKDDFFSKISSLVGLTFDYPTIEEWLYAAQGGKYSKGYKYSGSNDINAVAWYSGNSGNEVQEVRKLQPNELGFYDMSGNAVEQVVNPDSPNSEYYYGGYYGGNDNYCVVNGNIVNLISSGIRARGIRPVVRLK